MEIKNDAEHGNYLSYDRTAGSIVGTPSNQNSRGGQAKFAPDVSTKDEYIVEFDTALTAGNNQESQLTVQTTAVQYASANFNYGVAGGYLLKLSTVNSSTWTINDNSDNTVTLDAGAWYHVKLHVNKAAALASLTITDTAGTPVTEKNIIGINGSAMDVNNIYMLAGRYNPIMNLDNIKLRDVEAGDDFGELPTEQIQKLEFTKQIDGVIPQPEGEVNVANADYPLAIKATGTLGSDLTDQIDVEWTISGVEDEDGYITFTSEGTTANLNVRNGVSNWFGYITASASLNGGEPVAISTPFAVIGAGDQPDTQIAPDAGYPVNMNTYSDNLVGYMGTSNGEKTRDIILNNWSIYGSNAARTMKLVKDEDGTKSIEFASNGGSGSCVAVYQWPDQASQYILKFRAKFTSNMSFGVYYKTPNNTGSAPEWTASFGGGAITAGTETISNVPTNEWVDVVVSSDPSIGTYTVSAYSIDGELLGTTEEVAIEDNVTAQRYFCFQGTFPMYLQSFEAYRPTLDTMVINSEADVVKVPEKAEAVVEVAEAALGSIEYDGTNVNITTPNAVENAKLIIAEYNNGVLSEMSMDDVTTVYDEAAGVAKVSVAKDLKSGSKIMLWDSVASDGMKPLANAYTVSEAQPTAAPTDAPTATPTAAPTAAPTATPTAAPSGESTLNLSATLTGIDGSKMTGKVDWSLEEDYQGVSIEETGAQTAVLKVTSEAAAGTVVINAKYGETVESKEITLTSSSDSVVFTKSISSITIPFTGEEAVSNAFEAETRDKDGHVKEGTITYKFFDKTGAAELTSLPAGVTFENNMLTVTDAAKPTVIYVAAVNPDGLTARVKVNIHGLSFGFGSAEPEEGLTQVTADNQYTDKAGYGFADTSVLTTNDTNVSGNAAYRFKAKVPNGNYAVNVATTSATILSEVVEGIPALTGISKAAGTFNVAVCDGVLDLTFDANSNVSSITISQAAAKTELEKPALYAIGDSTTNSNNPGYSWGNCAASNYVELPSVLSGFFNNGMAGRDSVNFYNQGRVENVLLSICPGDYVTVNMGINSKETGEAASYYKLIDEYYVNGIIQRGGIPIIVTATPQGPVGNYAGNYNSETGVFTCNRGTGAHNGDLRKIAVKYDLNIIELGYWGDEYFNSLDADDVAAYNEANGTSFSTVIEMVQSWYPDHNHYHKELGTKIAEYIFNSVAAIENGSNDFHHSNDPHINEQ